MSLMWNAIREFSIWDLRFSWSRGTQCHIMHMILLTGTSILKEPAACILSVSRKKIYTLKMDALGLPQMLVPVPLWRLRQHLHTKYWYLPTKLHGVISQETVILKKFSVSITQIYKTLKRKISNIGYIIGNNLYLMNSFM